MSDFFQQARNMQVGGGATSIHSNVLASTPMPSSLKEIVSAWEAINKELSSKGYTSFSFDLSDTGLARATTGIRHNAPDQISTPFAQSVIEYRVAAQRAAIFNAPYRTHTYSNDPTFGPDLAGKEVRDYEGDMIHEAFAENSDGSPILEDPSYKLDPEFLAKGINKRLTTYAQSQIDPAGYHIANGQEFFEGQWQNITDDARREQSVAEFKATHGEWDEIKGNYTKFLENGGRDISSVSDTSTNPLTLDQFAYGPGEKNVEARAALVNPDKLFVATPGEKGDITDYKNPNMDPDLLKRYLTAKSEMQAIYTGGKLQGGHFQTVDMLEQQPEIMQRNYVADSLRRQYSFDLANRGGRIGEFSQEMPSGMYNRRPYMFDDRFMNPYNTAGSQPEGGSRSYGYSPNEAREIEAYRSRLASERITGSFYRPYDGLAGQSQADEYAARALRSNDASVIAKLHEEYMASSNSPVVTDATNLSNNMQSNSALAYTYPAASGGSTTQEKMNTQPSISATGASMASASPAGTSENDAQAANPISMVSFTKQ